MKKLTITRIRKALRHRLRKALTAGQSRTAAVQSFRSPTALRAHALTTQNVGTSFNYKVSLPKNFQISNPSLKIGNLQQFSLKRAAGSIEISAAFSAPTNEGYFAWAVARLLAPSLTPAIAMSSDINSNELRSTAGNRLILGPLATTDATAMERENLQLAAAVAGQFDVALFNPIGLRLKKSLETLQIADIEITAELQLNGAIRVADEFFVAELRNFAGASVRLIDSASAHLVAGLAATGLVLEVAGDLDSLHPKLRELLSKPLPPKPTTAAANLQWILRSEKQRRLALLHHSGLWSDQEFPSVDILLVTNRAGMLANALKQIALQTYPNFRIKVGAHNLPSAELADSIKTAQAEFGDRLEVVNFPEDATLGQIYGELTQTSNADFIAKFDDDDLYGPNHLLDAIMSLQYSGAGLFGRTPNLTWLDATGELLLRPFGDEEVFNKYIIGPTMVMRRSALQAVGGWRPTPWAVDKALIDRFQQFGGGIYRAGAFGWIYVRHDQGHTWLQDESHFRNQAEHIWTGSEAAELKQQVLG